MFIQQIRDEIVVVIGNRVYLICRHDLSFHLKLSKRYHVIVIYVFKSIDLITHADLIKLCT